MEGILEWGGRRDCAVVAAVELSIACCRQSFDSGTSGSGRSLTRLLAPDSGI